MVCPVRISRRACHSRVGLDGHVSFCECECANVGAPDQKLLPKVIKTVKTVENKKLV